jgi:tetratricopeptide (TPR) repeat protein
MHRKLGTLYAGKKETHKSLRHYNFVTKLDPNDVSAHRILANYYGKNGISFKAAPHYRELVRLDPDFAMAYNELRQETRKFSNIKNPIGRYYNALKILPNDSDLHFKIALYFFIVDDFNKTRKHFTESIRLQPEDGKNHYFAGLINHLMGNGVGAVGHMKRAEESFVKQKQVKNIADVRKHLRVYQNHYGIPGIQGDGSSIASAIHRQKKYN